MKQPPKIFYDKTTLKASRERRWYEY